MNYTRLKTVLLICVLVVLFGESESARGGSRRGGGGSRTRYTTSRPYRTTRRTHTTTQQYYRPSSPRYASTTVRVTPRTTTVAPLVAQSARPVGFDAPGSGNVHTSQQSNPVGSPQGTYYNNQQPRPQGYVPSNTGGYVPQNPGYSGSGYHPNTGYYNQPPLHPSLTQHYPQQPPPSYFGPPPQPYPIFAPQQQTGSRFGSALGYLGSFGGGYLIGRLTSGGGGGLFGGSSSSSHQPTYLGDDKKPYIVHHYHENREVPAKVTVEENALVPCGPETTNLCVPSTYAVCLRNGTILCASPAILAIPCGENSNLTCVKSTIPCDNSAQGLCNGTDANSNQTSTNTTVASPNSPSNETSTTQPFTYQIPTEKTNSTEQPSTNSTDQISTNNATAGQMTTSIFVPCISYATISDNKVTEKESEAKYNITGIVNSTPSPIKPNQYCITAIAEPVNPIKVTEENKKSEKMELKQEIKEVDEKEMQSAAHWMYQVLKHTLS